MADGGRMFGKRGGMETGAVIDIATSSPGKSKKKKVAGWEGML